jgi:hypothetical protein
LWVRDSSDLINLIPQRFTDFGGSVAANFEVMAYLELAPGRILNIGNFEVTYHNFEVTGHFVTRYQI